MNRGVVEEIKNRLPIDEVIGSYVKLEKAGKSLKARCPFHNEKSPSFFVSPDRGGYYCFGCGAKGDIFSFVEQFEGLDFRGALKILAEKAGVKLVYDDKADSDRDKLFKVMEEATDFYELALAKNKEASKYVESRGVNTDTRKLFRIGYAPEGWGNIMSFLKSKGYKEDIIEKVGLIKSKEVTDGVHKSDTGAKGKYYDRFRDRIMFPICDSSGRVIAFSGRILHDDGNTAKYLNSPDTPLYDKSLILYGLDKAKSEIRRLNYSIFVEGQMDLVMSHQAGIRNTVASSGTALTDETLNHAGVVSNLGLVRRLSPNIIIAFDADNAGRKAAIRASGIALALGMDVKIAQIVGGKDPADLVREDVHLWREVLKKAKPVIEFELDNVKADITDTRKIPKAIQERVLPLLVNITSASDRSYFISHISEKTSIPTDALWQDLKVVEQRQKSDTKSVNTESKTSSEIPKRIDIIERKLLGLLFLMQDNKHDKAEEYRRNLERIGGDDFAMMLARAEAMRSDLIFEAESFFGMDDKVWDKHITELLINFEEDMVNNALISAMQELKQKEKDGLRDAMPDIVKRCQALSLRKAEIARRRTK